MAAPKSRTALRFTRLRLKRWRNFRDVDLTLGRRAFFIGPNASGKSNILDCFRFLSDIANGTGGLKNAVESRGGHTKLRNLAARRGKGLEIEIAVGHDDEPERWQYSLWISQGTGRREPVLHRETVVHDGKTLLSRPNSDDNDDPLRLTQTHLEQISTNVEFRELATFLSRIKFIHVVPQLIREPERSVGRQNDPFGGNFIEEVASTAEKTRDGRLSRICKALQIAVPQLSEIKAVRDEKGLWHLNGGFNHWRPNAAQHTEQEFSDGTLRLLVLLWAVGDSGSWPMLLEEPELSLHSDLVRQIPNMLYAMHRRTGRQVLITTHSDRLLADEGIGLNEVHILKPGKEGTSISTAIDIQSLRESVKSGISLGEAVTPYTSPDRILEFAKLGAG